MGVSRKISGIRVVVFVTGRNKNLLFLVIYQRLTYSGSSPCGEFKFRQKLQVNGTTSKRKCDRTDVSIFRFLLVCHKDRGNSTRFVEVVPV